MTFDISISYEFDRVTVTNIINFLNLTGQHHRATSSGAPHRAYRTSKDCWESALAPPGVKIAMSQIFESLISGLANEC